MNNSYWIFGAIAIVLVVGLIISWFNSREVIELYVQGKNVEISYSYDDDGYRRTYRTPMLYTNIGDFKAQDRAYTLTETGKRYKAEVVGWSWFTRTVV